MIIDFHCDTLTEALDYNKKITYEDLKDAEIKCQVFAVFIDNIYRRDAVLRAMKMIDAFYSAVESDDRLVFSTSCEQIIDTFGSDRVACMLSIEGGEAISDSLELLRTYYRLGVRAMTLTWNGRNDIADGIGEVSGSGLTSFGRKVIREMNRIKMLVDISHLSIKGFWNVLELSTAPVIASHSNCKALCSHRRNLADDQMKALAECGGVMGITFANIFLNDNTASFDDIIRHIDYAVNLIGIDHVALGSDYDGCQLPKGMTRSDINRIPVMLRKLGYVDKDINKIMYQNWLNVIKEVIG